MKKMLKITIIAALLLFAQLATYAQNCPDYLIYRTPTAPYKLDSQTKSATCETGKTYKLVIALSKGKDYRLAFYASASFDNQIQFKIIDKSSGKTIIDLPGETQDNAKGTAILRPYLFKDKMVHPYFDFLPQNATKLEIIIAIKANEDKEEGVLRGCVGIFLQNKLVLPQSDGFTETK